MNQFVLGIETSCDDTGIGIFNLENHLIDHLKFSSASIQAQYGGVVPEIAARSHADHIISITQKLLVKHKIDVQEIVAIAYTKTPGLQGCLMVGEIFAQTLSLIWDKPLIALNHLYAHIFSVGINHQIVYPFIALVASGKTTALYLVNALDQIELLNATVDDAIGEAYDKVGRVMGLSYPAGPKIDQLFDHNLAIINLAKQPSATKPFSYSGIKTAAIVFWKKNPLKLSVSDLQKVLATSFQRWVIRSLINKINFYMKLHQIDHLAIVGGVGANNFLRTTLIDLSYQTWLVDLSYATDNGAMIAYYGSLLYKKNQYNN
ncbi:N(6)-L-threonylcarbamoyladenine synthase, subunit TsaD [[Mycoplasma] cavipharyngis]|uniref:tRNA (adenosine(37)-N6)-threonylcarbamoyltransferase complex transferase subunit TsaD n=1 Tax=[Mycoplasma] cavipharyngis TaxID=92757 RepID=UPI003704128C